jgi:hypothetical protein
MKIIKYISLTAALLLAVTSCEKKDVAFDMGFATSQAQFSVHYMVPVTSGATSQYIYRIDINDRNISQNQYSMSTYNAQPSSAGVFFASEANKPTNIKLYQRKNGEDIMVYNQDVTLGEGQQRVIIYDFDKTPIVSTENLPVNDDKSYDTDTIAFVKFYNVLFETPGVPTTVKLQYQYRYVLHPLYTLADEAAGKIPDGKHVGDATGETAKSKWANLGAAVGFGEDTGWQQIPAKKPTYNSTSPSIPIDYRILVEGGTVGVEKNADGILLRCPVGDNENGAVAYGTIGDTGNNSERGDYWNTVVGRCQNHFFSGTRADLPGSDVRVFYSR